jgi:hypothetical protein
MLASFCAKDAAVLAGTCVTVDDGVLVLGEPHPASATPTTAMMVGTTPRRMTFRPPVGFDGAPIGVQRSNSLAGAVATGSEPTVTTYHRALGRAT